MKLAIDSARRFLNTKSSDILSGKYQLTSEQLNHIKEILLINQSELADLLGVDKSTNTRIINGEQAIKRDLAMLVIERLNHEMESPGLSRILLAKIRQKDETKEKKHFGFTYSSIAKHYVYRLKNIPMIKLRKNDTVI